MPSDKQWAPRRGEGERKRERERERERRERVLARKRRWGSGRQSVGKMEDGKVDMCATLILGSEVSNG